MSGNSHFTVAIHVLTLLANHAPNALTSEYIAGSVNTNPVFIRRQLARLRTARLVTSQAGPGGGWLLNRNPEDITLRDVYRAVEETPLFALHSKAPNPDCPVGGNIQKVLEREFDKSLGTLERQLAETSIRDLVRDVRAAAKV